MKKNMINAALFAALMTTAMTSFTACSDNERLDDSAATAAATLDKNEFAINRKGGTIDIPVNFTGEWTAEVKDANNDDVVLWADVMQEKGHGPGHLQVAVDYLNPRLQQQERSTEIYLKSGDVTRVIRLRQYVGLTSGETVANADAIDGELDGANIYFGLWSAKRIGNGFDLLSAEATGNSVLNLIGIKKLMTSGDDVTYATLFRQDPNSEQEIKVVNPDTLEENTVRLKAGATVDLQYAKFKVKAKVDYDNKGLQVHNTKTINTSQSVEFMKSYADIVSIGALLEADPSATNVNKFVSVGFGNKYRKIVKAYEDGDMDKFEKLTKGLVDAYSPVVISGASIGGNMFISMQYDSVKIENKLDVKGTVEAELALAAVNIKAGVSIAYERKGLDMWNDSRHYITCAGGSNTAISKLTKLMNNTIASREQVTDAAQEWVNSIVNSNDNKDNTTVISYRYAPIYTLFPEDMQEDMTNIIRQHVANKYGSQKLALSNSSMGL